MGQVTLDQLKPKVEAKAAALEAAQDVARAPGDEEPLPASGLQALSVPRPSDSKPKNEFTTEPT